MRRIHRFFQRYGTVKRIALAIAVLVVGLLVAAKVLSLLAAQVFNYAAARQTMLRGTITVEEIHANTKGGVTFSNLIWKDPEGEIILLVPTGHFHVRPLDILMHRFASTTIDELTLEDATIGLSFDKDMQLDFISPDMRLEEQKKETSRPASQVEKQEQLAQRIVNFNSSGKKLKLDLIFKNCKLEARHLNHRYVMTNVNMVLAVDSGKHSRIDFRSEKFAGTARGEGVFINGDASYDENHRPLLHLAVKVDEVDPASVGIGKDLHDPVSLEASVTGPLARVRAEGTVSMKELHIPALDFENILGNFTYQDGLFTFSDVKGKVYGGDLLASGTYDVDSRAYTIHFDATSLNTRIALPDSKLSCFVNMTADITCDGTRPQIIDSWGSFTSLPGFYQIIPFKKVSGYFDNHGRELGFYDVRIETKLGMIRTDALHLDNGNLRLGKIYFIYEETGEAYPVTRREGESAREAGREARKNARRVGRDVGRHRLAR
ncbi:MAG: hypothetical protein SPI25_03070 [Dialister sp.]|nr:hypothetical protein [Dialister sp.]